MNRFPALSCLFFSLAFCSYYFYIFMFFRKEGELFRFFSLFADRFRAAPKRLNTFWARRTGWCRGNQFAWDFLDIICSLWPLRSCSASSPRHLHADACARLAGRTWYLGYSVASQEATSSARPFLTCAHVRTKKSFAETILEGMASLWHRLVFFSGVFQFSSLSFTLYWRLDLFYGN